MEAAMKTNTRGHAETSASTFLPGILTGQAAGLIMAVAVMVVFTVFLGKHFLFPVQVIGSTVFGEAALQGINFSAILAGLLLHQLGPSLLWGSIFGLLAKKFSIETIAQSLKLGLVIGAVSMIGPYLLIPFLMNTMHGVDFWNREVPMIWDWVAHLIFGASFVLYPLIKSKTNQA